MSSSTPPAGTPSSARKSAASASSSSARSASRRAGRAMTPSPRSRAQVDELGVRRRRVVAAGRRLVVDVEDEQDRPLGHQGELAEDRLALLLARQEARRPTCLRASGQQAARASPSPCGAADRRPGPPCRSWPPDARRCRSRRAPARSRPARRRPRGSISSRTCATSGFSKARTTCTTASTPRMAARNALPRPSPRLAPSARPGMSTTSMVAGTARRRLEHARADARGGRRVPARLRRSGRRDGEGVGGGGRAGVGQRVEEGRLADVGQADDADLHQDLACSTGGVRPRRGRGAGPPNGRRRRAHFGTGTNRRVEGRETAPNARPASTSAA